MGKTLNKLFKSYIHGDGGYLSKTTIRDPFLYVNITCAPGTYDANIEPLKDDVLFEDIGSIMRLVQRLFETVYDRKDEPGNADRMIHETLQVPNNPSQPAKTEPGNLNCSRDFSKMESVSTAPYQSHALPQTSPEDCRDEFGAKSVDLRSPNAFPQDHINPWTLEQKSCVRACRDPLSQLLTPSRANITVQPRSAFTQNPAKQAKYSCIGDDLGESPTQLRKANESPAEHKSLMQKFDTCSELERVAVNLRTRPSSESSLQEHTDFIAFPSPFEDECIQSGIAARFGNPIGAQKDLPCWSQEIQQKYLSRTSPSLWRTELITRPESSQSHVPFSLTKSLDFEHRKKDAIRLRQELLRREKRRQSTLPDFWNRQSEESNTLLKQESLNQNLRIEAIQSGNRRDISLVPFRAQTTHHNRVTSSACDKNSEFSNKSLIIHSGHRVKVNGTTAKDIPLESIPDELAMHHLATPCLDGIAKIRSLAQRLSEFDSYVGTDAYTPAFTLPLTADLVAQWQTILTELITSVYQCEGKEAEARIRLDLTVTSSYA